MKKILMSLVLVLGFASVAMAGYDKCAGCHNGKVSPDKAALTAKFKTAADFIKAAKESKNPMMNAVKGNEADLKAAAADLGLK
ncbi:hypothetical protein [Candidatus Magnetominusculus xianensis]|uniref:Cytochrome c domain-containing protein n=1 Tax=Candidatus Magnetominusculus xianensis TaxID=1748249 RepID=A0ABR5SK17_9BACT|nr:hypothetical protein [Candidatus Magnetominusculus xianensis]KWT92907.1 hypothetical protein ASN18_0342 [Candidatus Magnetominusculus xianensis]MBF0402911.1 hypothetical protein [Nitrospirota bacterium]